MSDQHSRRAVDIVRDLHALVSEPDDDLRSQPLDAVIASLQEDGVNAKDMMKRFTTFMSQLEGRRVLAAAHQARLQRAELLQRCRERMDRLASPLKESVQALLDQVLSGHGQVATVQFRNFQNADQEDLKNLLSDISTLEELSKHERHIPEG